MLQVQMQEACFGAFDEMGLFREASSWCDLAAYGICRGSVVVCTPRGDMLSIPACCAC